VTTTDDIAPAIDFPTRPTIAERREVGRAARKAVPRSSHAEWKPASDRRDPVDLLEEQNADRLTFLAPVRRGRMSASPFAFYRGAARLMATDLATTPSSGLTTQICGDAHVANFGFYASPERRLVFDMNDFDETLLGPWEWDVKRMAVSLMIAAQHRGFSAAKCAEVTLQAVAGYREAMAGFADMRTLDLWYQHLTTEQLDEVDRQVPRKDRKLIDKVEKTARTKDSLQALRKLTDEVDGERRIKSDPPVLLTVRDLPSDVLPGEIEQAVFEAFMMYRSTLSDDRQHLLSRFRPMDIALKVVGVGSVGTRCFIMLLQGRDSDDPLFLQVKEATSSVLEEHLAASPYGNHGQRVVEGQRRMQAVSDIFLGWTQGTEGRQFYVRQLRDWKGALDLDAVNVRQLGAYGQVCGWTLARGHARTGDGIAIAAYLGTNDTFDRAIADFANAYAAQNQADYDEFSSRIDRGELVVDRET
jgi:uncharacterized protein (DUF2252 family)